MTFINRKFSAGLGSLLIGAVLAGPAAAQDAGNWPQRPVSLVVPYAAGGFADTRMRLLARHLAKDLKQPVVVENKAGAGGVVGTKLVAQAEPDGYTIGTASLAPMSVNPYLMTNIGYDVKKDLAPVILIENSPMVLSVHPSVPAASVQELIELAKKSPGTLTFGSSGVGGAHHLSGEMLKQSAGIDVVHVPYKGGSPAASDLMAGHITMMFEMGYAAMPAIQGDKVRPLAVTSTHRLAVLPDVPTMQEAGVAGFESYNWQGIIVPAGTPKPIIHTLNASLNRILKDPEVVKAINDSGSEAGGGSPEDFAQFVDKESAKFQALIKRANITRQ